MSTCFDVYTLAGEGCNVIQTYPSQVHPGGGGAKPSGPITRREIRELSRKIYDDDEAIALALLLLD